VQCLLERWQKSAVILAVLLLLTSLNSVVALACFPLDNATGSSCRTSEQANLNDKGCVPHLSTFVLSQSDLGKLRPFYEKAGKSKNQWLRKQWHPTAALLANCYFSVGGQTTVAVHFVQAVPTVVSRSHSSLAPRAPPVVS
jgi:hypothetical protein